MKQTTEATTTKVMEKEEKNKIKIQTTVETTAIRKITMERKAKQR
jgi:hypothetical protein